MFGKLVPLPSWTHEFVIPQKLIDNSGGGAWCCERSKLNIVIDRMKPGERTITEMMLLNEIKTIEKKLPNTITHLIIVPPYSPLSSVTLMTSIIRYISTLNHERTHSKMFRRTFEWHIFVDEYMSTYFPDWDKIFSGLLRDQLYYELTFAVDVRDIAWFATEEILTRVALVENAPNWAKEWIALEELPITNDLINFVNKINERWDGFEELLGWLDACYANYSRRYGKIPLEA